MDDTEGIWVCPVCMCLLHEGGRRACPFFGEYDESPALGLQTLRATESVMKSWWDEGGEDSKHHPSVLQECGGEVRESRKGWWFNGDDSRKKLGAE